MTAPEAASIGIVASPRLPVNRLLELRAFVISVLGSSTEESVPERGDADEKINGIAARPVCDTISADRSTAVTTQQGSDAVAGITDRGSVAARAENRGTREVEQ
jgi:hypothetical protein